MAHKQVVIAGIDTEIGKTLCAAIVCEAFQADYWKPIQAGDLNCTDSHKVAELISNKKTKIHREGVRLAHAMSPHASADLQGIEINTDSLHFPEPDNHLVVELAGGLMVPINHTELNTDLLKKWKIPVVLVSKYYLGSINHTLLSWQWLIDYEIPFHGFVFNGSKNQSTFDIILGYTGAPCLLEIDLHQTITKEIVKDYADRLQLII